MAACPLSPETRKRVELMFPPEEWPEASRLLEERCGNNLPMLDKFDELHLERFRFAALKVSKGTIEGLQQAVQLTNIDWRDLLVAAGFANGVNDHESWLP